MRFIEAGRYYAVVLLSLFLVACGEYTIILPEENAEYLDGLPEQFVIEYTGQAPTKIYLNGVDVKPYFTISGNRATASGADLDGFLIEGNNTLSVRPGLTPARIFYFDSEGPKVVNELVQTLDGGQVNIKGILKDPSSDRGPMTLTLNGANVAVDQNGRYDVTVGKAAQYQFVSTDALGHQSKVLYADRGTLVSDMVAFEITENAINDFLPVFQELIEEIDLSQGEPLALFRENVGIQNNKKCAPVINFPCIGPINFDILSAEVSLTGGKVEEITFSDIDLKSGYSLLKGHWNGFSFDVVAENGYAEGQLKLDLLGLSDNILTLLSWFGLQDDLQFLAGIYQVGMPIDRFHVAATLAIEAENGDLNADIISLDDLGMGAWDAGDLDLEVPEVIKKFPFGLLEAILNTVFNGLEAARDLVLDFIGKIVVPVVGNTFIDVFLQEVPQVHVGLGLNNGALFSALVATDRISITVDQNGHGDDRMLVSMNGRVGAEASGEEPNIGLGLGQPAQTWLDQYFNEHFFPDSGTVPAELGPNPGITPEALGFRFTHTALPDPDTEQELAVNLSANLVNQALLGTYEAGMITLSLPVLANGLSMIIVEPDQANTLVNFEPTVPPEVVFRGNNNAMAYLSVTNYRVSIDKLNDQGQWNTTFESVITADVPIMFSTEGEEGLNLALLNPSFELSFGAGDGSLEQIILQQVFLEILVQQINTALSTIQVPDDIQLKVDDAGIEINPGEISLVGQPKVHLSFESNFRAL